MKSRRWTFLELAEMGGLVLIVVLSFKLLDRRPAKREVRASISCAGNLHDLARAAMVYAEDYNLRLPRPYVDGDGSGQYDPHGGQVADGTSDFAWPFALFPYTPSYGIYTCAAFGSDQRWDGRIAPVADNQGVSYGLNSRLGDVGHKLTRISFPAQTVLLFDLSPGMTEPWAALPDAGNDPHAGSSGNVEERVRANHYGKQVAWRKPGDVDAGYSIVAYLDGHAKLRPMDDLLGAGVGTFGNMWDPKR